MVVARIAILKQRVATEKTRIFNRLSHCMNEWRHVEVSTSCMVLLSIHVTLCEHGVKESKVWVFIANFVSLLATMNPTPSRDMHSDVLMPHFLSSGLCELPVFEIAAVGELFIWHVPNVYKMCELKPQLCGNSEPWLDRPSMLCKFSKIILIKWWYFFRKGNVS